MNHGCLRGRFVAGCDEGVLYVFERDEKEIYRQVSHGHCSLSLTERVCADKVVPNRPKLRPHPQHRHFSQRSRHASVCRLTFVRSTGGRRVHAGEQSSLRTRLVQHGHSQDGRHELPTALAAVSLPTGALTLSAPLALGCRASDCDCSLQITGLDVCVRKPLVVTCGADRSVRIWNYLTKNVEVNSKLNLLFTTEPLLTVRLPARVHDR